MKFWQQLVNSLKTRPNIARAENKATAPSSLKAAPSMPLFSQLDDYADLLQLLDTRQLVEVCLVTEPEKRYTSMVLNLDFNHQLLWLDNISTSPTTFSAGRSVKVRHHQNGYVLDIESDIISVTDEGMAIKLPSQAKYRLRRQMPRVTLRPDSPLMIKLKPFYVPDWDGTVRNISSKGVRIALAGNRLHQLTNQQHIPWLELAISDDFNVRCEGRITGFQFHNKPYRHTCVSIVFEKLKPETQSQLNQFIIGLLPHSRDLAA